MDWLSFSSSVACLQQVRPLHWVDWVEAHLVPGSWVTMPRPMTHVTHPKKWPIWPIDPWPIDPLPALPSSIPPYFGGCSRWTRSPMLRSIWAGTLSYSAEKIFSKYSSLCKKTNLSVTDRQTDGQTTYCRITALCVASRGKKKSLLQVHNRPQPVLFFAVCGPKFTKFGNTYGGDCSFQRRFPIDDILFPSGDIREVRNLAKILLFLGRQIFGGRDPKFLTRFYKLHSPPNMRQSLVTIGPETSQIWRRKKRIETYLSKI